MSDTTPAGPTRLLRADEERLRMVVAALSRGGKFAIVVADEALWPAAREFLESCLPGHRFKEIQAVSADDVSGALQNPLRDEGRATLLLRLGPGADQAIDALNWRREDLRGAKANVLVVLPGAEGHNRFLMQASDAYSYRDVLAVLEGERQVDGEPAMDDSLAEQLVARARDAQDPRERARLLASAAVNLHMMGQLERAQRLFAKVLETLQPLPDLTPEDRSLLAATFFGLASDKSPVTSHRFICKALDVLKPVASQYPVQFDNIRGQLNDALGTDLGTARSVVATARASGGANLSRQLACLGEAFLARENFKEAQIALEEAEGSPAMEEWGEVGGGSWFARLRATVFIQKGKWTSADSVLLEGLQSPAQSQIQRFALARRHAALLLRRAELSAARRSLQTLLGHISRDLLLTEIAGEQADLAGAIELLSAIEASDAASFDWQLDAIRTRMKLIERGIAANLVPSTERASVDERFETLIRKIEESEDRDPPWLVIDCLVSQADTFLRREGGDAPAIMAADRARQLARAAAPLLLAKATRRLVVAALRREGLAADVGHLLEDALSAATHAEDLGNIARLRGLQLWDATLKNSGAAEAEAAMNQAIEATGSVLLEAAICRQIGTALKRTDLLERARRIYRALPWPAMEGACLEALGALDLARNRYRTFGLVLRERILEHTGGRQLVLAETE